MNKGLRLHSRLPAAALLTTGFFLAGSAAAQEDNYERIVTIMRACSVIEDMVARVTCYDNNIAPRGAASSPAMAAQTVSPPAAAPPSQPQGFGAEMVPSTRERARAEQADEAEMQVSGSRMIEPGIYLVTMSDGAQWRFSDSASRTYDPPRAGDTVRLERGSLGSVFMHFKEQEGLRVRRVR